MNKEEQFHIINHNNNEVVLYSSNISFNGDNDSNAIVSTTTIKNENNISQLPTADAKEEEDDDDDDTRKKSYSDRFEQIFGKKLNPTSIHSRPRYFPSNGISLDFDLGTIFAKGREHFLKENSEARIDLLERQNNNLPYSPGHTIKGKIILLPSLSQETEVEKKRNKSIRGMKITLSGIEYAFAQGLQRVSTIEKYEKNIDLNGNENG